MKDLYVKTLLTLIAGLLFWLCFVVAAHEIAIVTDYVEEEEPLAEPYLTDFSGRSQESKL